MNTRTRLAAVLTVALALVACGQGEQPTTNTGASTSTPQETGPGTLEVASLPKGEIWVDGTSHGMTPATVEIEAGTHQIVIKREAFEPFETSIDVKAGETASLDAALVGSDPADPVVIAALADDLEVERDAFEEVERHRGGGSDALVTLLWPHEDVRLEGLTCYGIETGLDYMGEGKIEFKKGRKVIHSEPFEPETVMTVAPIPEVVRDALKRGDSVTWGLVMPKKRDSVTTKFKIVSGRSVDRQLEKLVRRKSFQRQPPITQALMRAEVLQNKRLYTEALLANLAATSAFPNSTQPYRGIVNALRRMDGNDSELWTLASQFVSGGGRGRAAIRGGGNLPTGSNLPGPSGQAGAPLANWVPPTAVVPKGLGPGDAILPGLRAAPDTPSTPNQPTDPATTPQPGTSPTAGPAAGAPNPRLQGERRRTEKHLAEIQNRADQLAQQAAAAQQKAAEASKAWESWEQDQAEAGTELAQAETDFEADPSPENEARVKAARERVDGLAILMEQTQTAKETTQQDAQAKSAAARAAERDLNRLQGKLAELELAGPPTGADPNAGPTGRPGDRRERERPVPEPATPRKDGDLNGLRRDFDVTQGAIEHQVGELDLVQQQIHQAIEAGDTPDPALLQQRSDILDRIDQLQQQGQAPTAAYLENLKELGHATTQGVEAAMKLTEAEASLVDAQEGVKKAEEDFENSPADPATVDALEAAHLKLAEARGAVGAAVKALESAVLD